MKRNNNIKSIVYIAMIFILFACNTTPFSFVRSRMVGTWIRTPIIPDSPESVQKWIFTEDGFLSLQNNLPDSITFGTGIDPTVIYSDSIEWDILWPVTGHFLQLKMEIPDYYRSPPPAHIQKDDSLLALYNEGMEAKLYIEKWEIIKINKKVLHLVLHSSGKDAGLANNAITIVGSRQIIFVRE